MPASYHLKSRATEDGPKIDYPQPHKNVEAALREAEKVISGSGQIVWIVDGEGNLVLPADQVRSRLSDRFTSPPGS
jgi:hypothetical protein